MKVKITIGTILLAALVLGLTLRRVWSAPLSKPTAGVEPLPMTLVQTAVRQGPWQYARNAGTTGYVDANDDAVEPNEMTWQNTGDYCALDYKWFTVSLAFFGYGDANGDGDANGGTFDCNVYVVEPYGSWEQIASFTGAIGELELTHYPASDATHAAGDEINSGSVDPNESYKWAEGPFTDNLSDADAWPLTIELSGATDGIGRANFNPLGARVLIVRFDNISGLTRVYAVVKGR